MNKTKTKTVIAGLLIGNGEKGAIKDITLLNKRGTGVANFKCDSIKQYRKEITEFVEKNGYVLKPADERFLERGIGFFQQSKEWDMDISFEALCEKNTVCRINNEYSSHWSDGGFGGLCIYMQHPDNDKPDTIITIGEDGFCYDGNGGAWKNCPEINTVKAIAELHKHRNNIMDNIAKEVNEGRENV